MTDPRPPAAPDDKPAGALSRVLAWRRARRGAKKARLARMTRGRRWLRRGLIAGTWLLGLLAALMVTAIVLYYTVADVPSPESLPVSQVVTIQYSDGTTLARIGSVDRTIVPLSKVPPQVRWAVLAAEDRGFYSEPGVSIRGTLRAALSDATGSSTQGGSGITQQYVKNAYLTNAQTVSRKIKELMIALKLSRNYSKDKILEFYLNTVYFGRGATGIEAAARVYFGEDVSRLTVAQGALLAGLLRAPGYYDPEANPTAARGRWKYVLDGMVSTGHLTAAQEAALTFPTTRADTGNGLGTYGWKWLLKNAVLSDLEAHGVTAREIDARGLMIRTTIDAKAQRSAVSAISTTFAHLTPKQRSMKNALVAVNPRTGGVIAYYGGTGPDVKGYDGTVDYNDWAGQNANPPGSTMKPFVLATVLDQTLHHTAGADGLAIDSIVDGSAKRVIDGTTISNDPGDKQYSSRRIQLALAMKYSLNTTFDLLALDAGPDQVAKTAHELGIAKTDKNGKPTLVDAQGRTRFDIGTGDYPVTPLSMAVGYATIANGGVRNDSYLVQQATASDGTVVYRHRADPTRVIDSRVTNDVTKTLEPVAAFSNVRLTGHPSAMKTGTVGISTDTTGNSDAWTVGFTPQISTAVWVGTGYRTKPIVDANGNPEYGRDLPAHTWQLFMNDYLAHRKAEPLPTKQLIKATAGSTTSAASSGPPSSASSTQSSSAPSTPPSTPPSRSTSAPQSASSSSTPRTRSSAPSTSAPSSAGGPTRTRTRSGTPTRTITRIPTGLPPAT